MMLNYRKSTQRVFCLIFLFCLSYTVIADVTEQKKVEVSQSKMVFTAHDSFMYVTIVGKLKNNSNYPLKDIILEAQFYNADGALIDTVSESSVPRGRRVRSTRTRR